MPAEATLEFPMEVERSRLLPVSAAATIDELDPDRSPLLNMGDAERLSGIGARYIRHAIDCGHLRGWRKSAGVLARYVVKSAALKAWCRCEGYEDVSPRTGECE